VALKLFDGAEMLLACRTVCLNNLVFVCSWTSKSCAAEFPLELHAEGGRMGADVALLRSRPAQQQATVFSSYNIHLTVLKYL